ncbi:hypothetical protein [Streptomyces sp. R41]|uniref:Tn3 transposase DDE domain-containing protein n=1 Tax=Streptomyces sp. R41 TaxID=3238632 RepID=A0AB39R5Z6_9ACTN
MDLRLTTAVQDTLPFVDSTGIPTASKWCQRWNGLRHSFRHGSEGGFDARRCAVEMLPEKAANAVIVLEILTKMILSTLAEKIAEGGQDTLPAEHANLDDLLIVQRLLGHASSTMRSPRHIRRTNLLVAKAIAE